MYHNYRIQYKSNTKTAQTSVLKRDCQQTKEDFIPNNAQTRRLTKQLYHKKHSKTDK